jgi:hypothetical protein
MHILLQQQKAFLYSIRIRVRKKSEPLENTAVNMHVLLFCIAGNILHADAKTE